MEGARMSWDIADMPRGRGSIELRIRGRTAELVLNNPDARNAMSVGMMVDLVSAIDTLEGAGVRAVLIYGVSAGGFCAGGDLRDVREHLLNASAAHGMPKVMGDVLDRLSSLPAVVVAAVEGAALGGGAELLTAADWVVASRGSRIGFVHAALGVSPGWGGARRLIRRVGRQRAVSILLQAKRYDAEVAQSVGLVDQVVSEGTAVEEAAVWIESVLRHPEQSIAGVLEILRSTSGGLDAVRQQEREVFARLWGGEAHQAALARVKAGG